MKKLIITGISLVLLIVVFVLTWQHFRDVKLRHEVVGSWRGIGGSRFSMTIASDGSQSWGTTNRPDFISGTWRIRHGILILTTTNEYHRFHGGSSLVGVVMRCRVVHLDDQEFVFDMGTNTITLTR
jgi:hypothetical protein